MEPISPDALALLTQILELTVRDRAFPLSAGFRSGLSESSRAALAGLVSRGLLKDVDRRYLVTVDGLRALSDSSALASSELAVARSIYAGLRNVFPAIAHQMVGTSDLARRIGHDDYTIGRIAAVLAVSDLEVSLFTGWQANPESGFFASLGVSEAVVESDPLDDGAQALTAWAGTASDVRIESVQISGYGPLGSVTLDCGGLRVLVGANGTGKSSLASALTWLAALRGQPLPPDVDSALAGRQIFTAGRAPRITIEIIMTLSGLGDPVHYSVTVTGPVGTASVLDESLSFAGTRVIERAGTSIRYRGVRGANRIGTDQLVLRRFESLGAAALSAISDAIGGIVCYAGFDVSVGSGMRSPRVLDDAPLVANGHNISSVLHNLKVQRDASVWSEVESTIRSVVPGFVALGVRTAGRGRVIATSREHGVSGELTLADLSEGTLQLIGLVGLLADPLDRRFVILDEPERGLHPRAIHAVAGLILRAAQWRQVLVLTHSSELLDYFDVSVVRVVRKADGLAEIVKPGDSAALTQLCEQEGLSSVFRSQELEHLA